jgi:hypothetical protein
MADINAVAQQFTDFYYQTFDTNRANLAPLYVRSSFVVRPRFHISSAADLFPSVKHLCSPSRGRRSKARLPSSRSWR